MQGGGSKADWHFSKKSSLLEALPVPKRRKFGSFLSSIKPEKIRDKQFRRSDLTLAKYHFIFALNEIEWFSILCVDFP